MDADGDGLHDNTGVKIPTIWSGKKKYLRCSKRAFYKNSPATMRAGL
jgi:hypothetical protein